MLFSVKRGVYLSYGQIILSQAVTDYKGYHKMLTKEVTHATSSLQSEIPGPYRNYWSLTAAEERTRGAVTVSLQPSASCCERFDHLALLG